MNHSYYGAQTLWAVLAFYSASLLPGAEDLLKYPTETKKAPAKEDSRRATSPTGFRDYTVVPMDVLGISVFQEAELTREVKVSQTGSITFPLLGNVSVAGLKVTEVENRLATLLDKDYIKNPQVSVSVKEYSSRRIFVMGEVKNSGPVEIPPEEAMTILQAIARAGGFTTLAATDHVRIRRTINGKQDTIEVNATDLVKNDKESKDVELQPGDVVFVPQRFF